MTSSRDLGPPLAIAGGAIVLAAMIAGFIVVGGPGDARDRRLDDMTADRIASSAQLAQCAYVTTGKPPATLAEASATAARDPATPGARCGDFHSDRTLTAISAGDPQAPGDVTYTVVDPTHVRLCGIFRSAVDGKTPRISPSAWVSWPELGQARPAGRHCYELQLKEPPPPASN